MKTIKTLLFGAMALVSIAGAAQSTSYYDSYNYSPDKKQLDSVSENYKDPFLNKFVLGDIRYCEMDTVKRIAYDTSYTYNLESKKYIPTMLSEVTYNSQNLIIKHVGKFWDSATSQWWIYDSLVNDFDSRGNNIYCERHGRDNKDSLLKPDYKIVTTYYKNNTDSTRFNYVWQNNDWVISQGTKNIYEFDSHNNVIKVQSYSYSNGEWYESVPTTVTRTYNNDGFILTERQVNTGLFDNLTTNVYDEKNNLIFSEKRMFKNNAWIILDTLKQKFDDKGNVIEEYSLNKLANGDIVSCDSIKSTYNSAGKVVTEWARYYNQSTKKWNIPSMAFYFYDKYNRLIKYQYKTQVFVNGAFELRKEKNWFYKVKTESLKINDNKQIVITFDSELAKSTSLTQNVQVKAKVQKSGDFFVTAAKVSDTDSSSMIIECNRPLTAGEQFTIIVNTGLKTENGRNVSFTIEMGNTATGIETTNDEAVSIFPSQTSNTVNIASTTAIDEVKIYSMEGTELLSSKATDAEKLEISLGNLPAATYIVKVITATATHSSFVVKQ